MTKLILIPGIIVAVTCQVPHLLAQFAPLGKDLLGRTFQSVEAIDSTMVEWFRGQQIPEMKSKWVALGRDISAKRRQSVQRAIARLQGIDIDEGCRGDRAAPCLAEGEIVMSVGHAAPRPIGSDGMMWIAYGTIEKSAGTFTNHTMILKLQVSSSGVVIRDVVIPSN